MAFPDNLWIASAYSGNIQKFDKDSLSGPSVILGSNNPQGVFVSQDRVTVYTANKQNNTISVIRSGSYINSVVVGKEPYGMTENLDNILYVSCYGDNTVYKIDATDGMNFKILKVINVDPGPAGLTCDSDGIIWVACSKAGTICKIVDDVVTLKLSTGDVKSKPVGICCDGADGIWVANYASNTVVRFINKATKILDIDIHDHPTDIVADGNNNIYVAGYLKDIITYIPASNPTKIEEIYLPTGSGVSALSVNSENDIYAVASISNKIFKLHNRKIVDTIVPPDIIPVGFGDFTGGKLYNVFGAKAKAEAALTPEASAVKLMSALSLKFDVKDVKEGVSTVTFKITSDDVNLSVFDHVKLNGNTGMVNSLGVATFILPSIPTITTLTLTGYFDAAEAYYVPFNKQNFDDIFKIVVGTMVEDSSGNFTFTETADPYKTVNSSNEVSNIIIETAVDGNMTVLIPSRVQAKVEKGLILNGMQIYDDWAIDPADVAAVTTAISAYPGFVAYMNPYPSYAGAVAILNRYKL